MNPTNVRLPRKHIARRAPWRVKHFSHNHPFAAFGRGGVPRAHSRDQLLSGDRGPAIVSRPLALAEHRHAASVGVNAVDVGLGRTDHPVDVNEALVAALRRDLLPGSACRRRRSISSSTGRARCGEAAFSSNSVLKNSSPLFEIGEECGTSATSPRRARALIGVEHLLQHFLAARGLGLDDAAFLEPAPRCCRSACPDRTAALRRRHGR